MAVDSGRPRAAKAQWQSVFSAYFTSPCVQFSARSHHAYCIGHGYSHRLGKREILQGGPDQGAGAVYRFFPIFCLGNRLLFFLFRSIGVTSRPPREGWEYPPTASDTTQLSPSRYEFTFFRPPTRSRAPVRLLLRSNPQYIFPPSGCTAGGIGVLVGPAPLGGEGMVAKPQLSPRPPLFSAPLPIFWNFIEEKRNGHSHARRPAVTRRTVDSSENANVLVSPAPPPPPGAPAGPGPL